MQHCSILYLTIGIPGSGKTTWVNEYKKAHPYVHVVSTDEIRKELTGIEQCINPTQNDMIHEEARKRVSALINDDKNYGGNNGMGPVIIVDSTNTEKEEWIKYKLLKPTIIIAKVFDKNVDECFERIKMFRPERIVPKEILQMKKDQLEKSKPFLSKIFNMIL